MKSVPSSACLCLSKNALYSAVINPLGSFYHGGMQSVPSSAQRFLSENSFYSAVLFISASPKSAA